MTSYPKVGWRVPSGEYERFRECVRDKHGEYKRYAAYEIESAMREWLDSDDYHDLEDLVTRLVEAAGRTPTDYSHKKYSADALDGEETTYVQIRINPELKDEFKADTKENSEYGYGVTLGHALCEYRQGGRAKRLEERLGRVADDAEKLLSEFADTDGADTGLSLREKRTIAICNRLSGPQGSEFLKDDLHDAIAAVAGDSEPTLREYEEQVLDRLDVALHPNASSLYIPRERAEEIAETNDSPSSDIPAFERKDYADLSKEEKVDGIRIELARKAQKRSNGKSKITASAVNENVFNDYASPGHIYDLMRIAGNTTGYDFTTHSGLKALLVSLEDVTDETVIDVITLDAESNDASEEDTMLC